MIIMNTFFGVMSTNNIKTQINIQRYFKFFFIKVQISIEKSLQSEINLSPFTCIQKFSDYL